MRRRRDGSRRRAIAPEPRIGLPLPGIEDLAHLDMRGEMHLPQPAAQRAERRGDGSEPPGIGLSFAVPVARGPGGIV